MPKTLKIELSRIISCWNHETWSKINEQRVGSSLLEIVGDTKISKQSIGIFKSFVNEGVLPELDGVDSLTQIEKENAVFKENTVFNILASVKISNGSVREKVKGVKLEYDNLHNVVLWQSALSEARLSKSPSPVSTPPKSGGESELSSSTGSKESSSPTQTSATSPSPEKQTPAQSPADSVGGTPSVTQASEQAFKKKSSKVKDQQNIFMRALIAITYLFRALAYMLWSPMLGFVYSSMDRMQLSSVKERVTLSKEYEVTPVIPQKGADSGSDKLKDAGEGLNTGVRLL